MARGSLLQGGKGHSHISNSQIGLPRDTENKSQKTEIAIEINKRQRRSSGISLLMTQGPDLCLREKNDTPANVT